MALIRPRLTDHFDLNVTQASADFAIPFMDEDLPLYVDPFLLWKSPSLQDQSLHGAIISSFNRLGWLAGKGRQDEAVNTLVRISECDEVGLGASATRTGKRIGAATAAQILSLFGNIPYYRTQGLSHIEEVQLYVDGISKDRISDMAANLVKSFLIDFTMEQAHKTGIPVTPVTVKEVYNHQRHVLEPVTVPLPVHPTSGQPLLLVPKRWLRYSPWVNYEDYFQHYVPKDDVHSKVEWDRVGLLNFNRDNYGVVEAYVRDKERTAHDCAADPLFKQIPVISAKRKLAEILALPSGKDSNADKKYEDAVTALLASMFYPDLDFATTQARTDSGAQIRDLIFYMNRKVDFLSDIANEYGSKQLVFELKNVRAISRDHINQLNRYLTGEFGAFGVLVTRNRLPRPMQRNTIDLWAGQRRCIISISDEDLEIMVILNRKNAHP